jgi:asparagine synthase (glutamine-hydrolysing)
MLDGAGRVLVYNGEVYNFQELRRGLEAEGVSFASSGDTEVVLAVLSRRGADALPRLNGMFALALWDPEQGHLLLARDRLGIKPLFWAPVAGGVVFASELPALLEHPGVARDLDRHSLGSWLQLGFSAGEATLVRGVRRLLPGHLLEVDASGVRMRAWYDPLSATAGEIANLSAGAAVEELDERILRAVRERLVSDVRLGCFLSGGVDSATVTAAAAASQPGLETLTVGFEGSFDETPAAARTAAALGLRHMVERCSPGEMMEVFGRWEEVAGDPIADPSLAPTWAVSRAARRRWTVALSGDGGDELLSGYPRLRFMPRLDRLWSVPGARAGLRLAPRPARRWGAKLSAALAAPTPWHAYQCLQGVWPGREAARLLGQQELCLPWPQKTVDRLAKAPPWRRWRLLDLLTFLPERVLAKVDRASMAHSLEVRVPLLDHRVVELLLTLSPRLTSDKRLLRGFLGRHLPGSQPPRKKRGFEVPLAAWLRGPLRDPLAEAVLGTTAGDLGLDRRILQATWQAHQDGRGDHAERLFAVAVLVRWSRRWLS